MFRRLFFVLIALTSVVPWEAVADDLPTGDATIRGIAGDSEIVIRTTARLAGAIDSLTWGGREFIDSTDHGRQLQSASNLDLGTRLSDETFNPTEAGSRRDGTGPTSTSRLLQLVATERQLQTTTQMAFWLAPGETSGTNTAKNSTLLSNHLLTKRVQIGYGRWPHAIQYDVTFSVPIGEHHRHAVFEAVTGYMPADFESFWHIDLEQNRLAPLDDGPGEQPEPVILATANGLYAMGIYSPDQPSLGYHSVGYGRFRFSAERVVKWNCVFRKDAPEAIPAGEYSFRNFVVVGSLPTVRETMLGLHREFRPLPPTR